MKTHPEQISNSAKFGDSGSSPKCWRLASSYGNYIFKSELTVP
jgi:hypothetical protein